ncbi:MAG: amidohydrolase [Pseudomonadota bacterium]
MSESKPVVASPGALRVTLVQTRTWWHDCDRNLAHFAGLMAPLAGTTDVIVLTETFTSGFTQEPQEVAQRMDGPAVRWMQAQASRLGAAVTGSLAIEDAGGFRNRLVWASPDGEGPHWYDKRHLFGLGGEDRRYAGGATRVTFSYRGWRICPMICYDLRFPVWTRNQDDYDLLLFVANWPRPRVHAWRTLLRARAIENQAYVVGVNRIGEDGNGIVYPGASAAIDFLGEDLVDLGDREAVETVMLSWEAQERFRRKLPFQADRDAFDIHGADLRTG